MGMRGPKPEPASVKEAKGNPGRRPIGSDPASTVASGAVTAPAWLKGEALRIWDRLAPRLVALKLLSPTDAEAFGRYCRNFARWQKMQAAIDKDTETYTVETASGIVHRTRPEFLISDRLERQLLAIEDRFGLNPAERQRIFAARASAPAGDDLFGRNASEKMPPPAKPQEPRKSPVGFLQ